MDRESSRTLRQVLRAEVDRSASRSDGRDSCGAGWSDLVSDRPTVKVALLCGSFQCWPEIGDPPPISGALSSERNQPLAKLEDAASCPLSLRVHCVVHRWLTVTDP